MFHQQPLLFLRLFPLFVISEGYRAVLVGTWESLPWWDSHLQFVFLRVPLASRTSSLTLSIAGIFKEVCTLLLGDQISLLNWLGFALCLLGISWHIALKAVHSRGDGGLPLKGLGSSPDLELLLWSSQQEDEDNEEAEYFIAQGQQ